MIPPSARSALGEVLRALRGARVVRLRREVYESLTRVDDIGRLAKSAEARILRIIGENEGQGRELKQLRDELRSAIRRASDPGPLKEVLEALESSDIGKLTEERPVQLRDLRNILAHGKLTRELLISEQGKPSISELLRRPAPLYIITTEELITYLRGQGRSIARCGMGS